MAPENFVFGVFVFCDLAFFFGTGAARRKIQNHKKRKRQKQNFRKPQKNKNHQKQQNKKYFELNFHFPDNYIQGVSENTIAFVNDVMQPDCLSGFIYYEQITF